MMTQNDFGFTTLSNDEVRANVISTLDKKEVERLKDTNEHLKDALKKMHDAIIPMLVNLNNTAQKEYIYWPNRGKVISEKIRELNALLQQHTFSVDADAR